MIFHAEKRTGFVMLDKAPINNPNLSLRAKGLLAYLLSKPPDWRPQTLDICAHCKESPAVVRSAMQELAKAGHAVLIKESGGSGRMDGSRWTIYEKPQIDNEIKQIGRNMKTDDVINLQFTR